MNGNRHTLSHTGKRSIDVIRARDWLVIHGEYKVARLHASLCSKTARLDLRDHYTGWPLVMHDPLRPTSDLLGNRLDAELDPTDFAMSDQF